MTKFLDLDKLESTTEYSITLHGVTHEMKSLSVGDYIKMTKLNERMGKAKASVEQIEIALEMITTAFPSMSDSVVKELSFDQMGAIINFIMVDSTADAPKTEGEAKDAQGN